MSGTARVRTPRGVRAGRLGEEGLTLLEAVIAVTLMVVGLVGIAVSFPVASIAVTDGWVQTTTVGLANEVIEQAQRVAFDSLPSFNPTLTGFPDYTRTVTVQTFDGGGAGSCLTSPTVNCRRITVTVTHSLGFTATLTTVIARP